MRLWLSDDGFALKKIEMKRTQRKIEFSHNSIQKHSLTITLLKGD